MRHTILPILSILALSSSRLVANDIEPGKEFYNATRIPTPIVIDGNLSEWTGVPVLADPKYAVPKGSGTRGTYVLFEEYNGGTWTGPDDQTSAVQVVWDADNVYIGIVVTDDYHENSANSAWNGDSAQLMIANAARNAQIALYNYALGGVEGALGEVIVMHEAGPGGTEAVVTRDSVNKKTTYEIKMPAESLSLTAPLTAGSKIGLGMAINDGDEFTPGQKGWGGLGAHSIVFGKTPSETALLTLITNLPGADRLFFSAINPTIDSFSFRVTDKGASVLNPASVKLIIDGGTITLTASPKVVDATDFSYKRSTPYPASSDHTYSIEAKDTLGNTITSEGSFKTIDYATLPASLKVTTVNTSKPGFIWNVFQNEADQANSNARAEKELAGEMTNPDGTPMDNLADPNAIGVALDVGTPAVPGSKPIRFEIATVINMSQNGTDNVGNFTDALPAASPRPDDVMPGIPGTSGSTDGIAGELITWVELPQGMVTLGVNSDDGFATVAGQVGDKFLEIPLGVFDAGRGAADTLFRFYVEQAGFYKLRTIWEEGGGGANIEWFSVKADGTKVLLNDAANGGFKTYRARTDSEAAIAVVRRVEPAPNQTGANPDQILVEIRDGDTAVDKATVSLKVDGAAVNATVTKTGKITTVDYRPSPLFAASSKHTAIVAYTEGTNQISRTWGFTTGVFAKDKLHSIIGILGGAAAFSADSGGHTAKAGDFAMDFTTTGGRVFVKNAGSFLNPAATNDEMSCSLWVKKYDNADSSAFWANSPSSNNGQRGWQSHLPWSDGSIYFDTAGCCDGATQRINAGIDTFAGYSGDAAWWNTWHHFVFSKKLSTKEIWIDGQLFLTGDNTSPLPTDFTDLYLGSDGTGVANNMHGLIDDFAVYATALAEADIKKLFDGTAPDALAASTKILAYWNFNDRPVVSVPPTLTWQKAANGLTLTFTGKLQSADRVTGPWNDTASQASPQTVPTTGAAKFFRAAQ